MLFRCRKAPSKNRNLSTERPRELLRADRSNPPEVLCSSAPLQNIAIPSCVSARIGDQEKRDYGHADSDKTEYRHRYKVAMVSVFKAAHPLPRSIYPVGSLG